MRGPVGFQGDCFHTFNLEEMIPAAHPLRTIKRRADQVLASMSRDFNAAYGKTGRPGVPPERLLKSLLLQRLYTVRSEIQLCEQISYNMLFRWFLGLQPSDRVWTPEVFSMNRRRFEDHGLVRTFFDRLNLQAVLEGLAERGELTGDGSLIQSYANATHRSLIDSEARLARKSPGQPALLSHSTHFLMENRSGLCMDIAVDVADGHAERRQALAMIDRVRRKQPIYPTSLAADGGYAAGPFLAELEKRGITPLLPIPAGPIRGADDPNPERRRAARARRAARRRMGTTAYRAAQRVRKRVEEIIGWCKTIGGLARTRFVGRWKIQQQAYLTAAAYNLLRLARLKPLAA